jgi:hypothetical protein
MQPICPPLAAVLQLETVLAHWLERYIWPNLDATESAEAAIDRYYDASDKARSR